MTIFKNQYYLFIENTREINLRKIKKRNKFTIIYRPIKKEKIEIIKALINNCKKKGVKLLIANNIKLLNKANFDGLYVSAFNKNLNVLRQKKNNKIIVGSAHSYKEIYLKKKQGCETIIYSRLFKTDYKNKQSFLGIIKFNIQTKNTDVVALGGVRLKNLNKVNLLKSNKIALLTEVKKKPAKIFNRLF